MSRREWEENVTSKVVTVFAPGFGASLCQAAKYVRGGVLRGPGGVELAQQQPLSNGALAVPSLLHNVWTGVEHLGEDALPYDVWQPPPFTALLLSLCISLCYLYMPFVVLRRLLLFCMFVMLVPLLTTFLVLKWSHKTQCIPYIPLPWRVSIGQSTDVDHYIRICRDAAAANRDKRLVLFGTSRGASVVLQAYLTMDSDLRHRVCMVVMEAPFDDVDGVLDTRKLVGSPWTNHVLRKILPWVTRYRPEYPSPVRQVEIANEAEWPVARQASPPPLIFITSAVDVVVTPDRTENLMGACKQYLPKHDIHHLQLQFSSHSSMPLANDLDQNEYQRFMDGLYRKYVV